MNNIVKSSTTVILLVIISLCMIVLLLLNLSVVSADMRMAQKYSEAVTEQYELEKKGQMWLFGMDGNFFERTENVIGDVNERHLTIVVEPGIGGDFVITEWKMESPKLEGDILDNLWEGE